MKSSLGQYIVSATSSKNIIFFSTNPLTAVYEYDSGFDQIESFSWNCDNKRYCYSGSNEISVACNTEEFYRGVIFGKDNHHSISKFLRSKPDQLITTGKTDSSFLWQIVDNNFIGLKAFKHSSFSQKPVIAFNKDDSVFAISGKTSTDNILIFYEIGGVQTSSKEFKLDKNEASSFIEFCPFMTNRVALGTTKGSLIVHDIKSSNPLLTLNNKQLIPICGMTFSPQTKNEVYLGYTNNIINIYDLNQRKTVNTISIESKISCFSVFENGVYLLVGTSLGKVYQYDNRNTNQPVDVLQLGKDQIDMISIQNGETKVQPSAKKPHSRISLFSKTKRSSKEATSVTGLLKGNNSIKDIKNLFTSPAVKKAKQNDDENENSINIPQSIHENQTEKSPILEPKNIIQSSKVISEGHSLSDTTSFQDEEISKRTLRDNADFSIEDMMYEIEREFRDLRLNIIKQNVNQTMELKNYICTIIENSSSREQELIIENNRLREEINYYRNLTTSTKNGNVR